MAKIMIGPDGGSYSFNKTAKTITINLPNTTKAPTLESLLLITDVTNNIIIYNFADPAKGASLSGNVYTLDYDTNTGSFANTDKLQIYYYLDTPQAVSMDDIALAFRIALAHSNKNNEAYNGRQRITIEDGTLGLISTVSTVTTIANPGFRHTEDLIQPDMINNWNSKVRLRIT